MVVDAVSVEVTEVVVVVLMVTNTVVGARVVVDVTCIIFVRNVVRPRIDMFSSLPA